MSIELIGGDLHIGPGVPPPERELVMTKPPSWINRKYIRWVAKFKEIIKIIKE